ncbi:hypothetical protein V6N12_002976 [Hibiscus sabdariffa]|uniref:DUF4283 domain-containing protein n=1 Tax=Hibiscus sabdariffa TaxID=183260 RepID=A0ABR2EAJ1_9ROSI
MVDPPDDSRLPKKQRRRDETPSEIHSHDHPPATTIECDNSIIPKPAASYRDMVIGSSDAQPDEELVSLDDDYIDLLEDDGQVGESEGIPFIDISKRVQSLALKSMKFTLVVKVLGRRIGYNVLHNRIYSIWKPSHPLKLIDIENDYFLVKFSSRVDYIKVLSEGP